MDGILIVDKPAGPTSHDVVDRVRRAIGIRRVGHTGTLDPIATGVLPLVVGRATRLAQFLTTTDKTYEAAIRLGVATDTYDSTGRTTGSQAAASGRTPPAADILVDRAGVERALAGFVGTYRQAPPPFSAKKVDGVRAYAKARQGAPVEPAAVDVTVHELAIVSFDGALVTIRVTCGPGFYVRALAHALGERLGVGAHLEALRRTKSGGFDEHQAVGLDLIEQEGVTALRRLLLPADALLHLPAVTLTPQGVRRAGHGRLLTAGDLAEPVDPGWPGPVRLVGPDGRLVAVARAAPRAGALHPFVVMG